MPTIPDYLNTVYTATGESLGQLHVTTGEIVACDPLSDPDRTGFERRVAPGKYAVEIFTNEYDEIALACLRLADRPAVRWEMATLPGQDVSTLKDGYLFGYPVDAGMGCFMDRQTAALLEQHESELEAKLGDQYISYYDDVIDEEMAKNDDFSTLNFQPYPDNPLNVIMFQSGYGDGFYGSYWGLDANGDAVCLVTDFGILGADEEA